jgi:hypothetical protein
MPMKINWYPVSAILLIILLWTLIIIGGCYIWKNVIQPKVSSTVKVMEINSQL